MSTPLVSKELEEYVIRMRRHFHQHPELSRQEVHTQERICQELDQMHLPYVCIPDHHVVAWLEGEEGGKKAAIRGDIDALPMKEETDLPFRSVNDNAAHTCGHDSHTAILLGTAKYLSEHHEGMKGKIFFCFQGAEETSDYGANEVVEYLNSIGGVDHAFSLHTEPVLRTGQISVEAGPRAAGSYFYKVVMRGLGGHGSRPDRSRDPILPACEAIQKISAIPANRNNPLEPLVVNVAYVRSDGTAPNVIPETVQFGGTIRYFDPKLPDRILPLIRQMIEGTAASYGETAEVEFIRTTQPVINSKEAGAIAAKVVSEIDGLTPVELEPDMGSDDFCEFTMAYSGMYAFLGITDDPALKYPQHHPKFHLDENALKYGVEFFIRYAKEYLQF